MTYVLLRPAAKRWPLLAALALLPAVLFAATEIHLCPSGNDANSGTAALPVKTPQGAQLRVRSLIQAGLSDSLEVIFVAGTYSVDAPLILRPEDSGTAAFPITWKAAAGADVNSKIYTPGAAAAKVAPIPNRITRNSVEYCGTLNAPKIPDSGENLIVALVWPSEIHDHRDMTIP